MKSHHWLLAAALSVTAVSADAAMRIYTASFALTDIPGPIPSAFGSFIVELDPEAVPYVNDAIPVSGGFFTPGWGYDGVNMRIDFFPFGSSDPGFLVGAVTGGLDTNNTLLNDLSDYRVRFILNPDYSLVSARGALRYGIGVGGSAPVQTFGFDTAAGVGVVTWTVTVTGGDTPAIPEPASWAMMIAGFGFVGSALRRRRPARSLA
ncbi:MAG: PEPxxWA-CTERM sorting domain-containing protein [Sphingomonadaceae bacterium]